jgi:hypothetical protein
MSGYAERVAELGRRLNDIDLRLKSIDAERASNVVEASQGAQSALRKIAELDAEADQLHRSKAILTSAADQLDQQLREEEAAAAAADHAERQAQARKIGSALVALNGEIDLMLTQLREAFERREALLGDLRNHGGISSSTVNSMLNKEPGTSAARYAGLGRYVSIEPVPISAIRALASSNGILPTEAQP